MAFTRTTSAVVRSFSEGGMRTAMGTDFKRLHVADPVGDGKGVQVQVLVQKDVAGSVVHQPEEPLLGIIKVAHRDPPLREDQVHVGPQGLVAA